MTCELESQVAERKSGTWSGFNQWQWWVKVWHCDCGRGGRMWISSRWDVTKKSIHYTDPAQPVPLKKRIMKRTDQINRQYSQKYHGGHCHLALKTVQYTSMQGSPEERRATQSTTHTHNRSTSCSVFLFYFTENITLLVADINHYYVDPLDKGFFTIPDAYKAEMFVFQAITVQLG